MYHCCFGTISVVSRRKSQIQGWHLAPYHLTLTFLTKLASALAAYWVAAQIGHTSCSLLPWLMLFLLPRIPAVGLNPSSHTQPEEAILYGQLRGPSHSSQTEFFDPCHL